MTAVPSGWQAGDDFAAGVDGNRLPRTEAPAGTSLSIAQADGGAPHLDFRTGQELFWRDGDGRQGTDRYEAVGARHGVHCPTVTDAARRLRAVVAPAPGRQRVGQVVTPGVLTGSSPGGVEPAPSRDLMGGAVIIAPRQGDLPRRAARLR
ncbi:MoaF N-terminal domain-containing protein [Streptomyces phyllanthi]|uniref:Molybdenum cofactor biosynthesis protein F N-terminal domain-containing protein n=1 Tax=Streptomyces phyllanthi TaxID=1803180 RepID=A0A5N8WA26_9ACTN|nr:MoaF N-terminal domain-containing protein [Streptomyces phyllanthi]MPY44159.1 hypothetical protein [Streptomyces phyllanthi]